MLFNSVQFLIFFPIVTILFFILPHKYRWAMLLAASCYFYMAFIPAYLLILVVTIVVDYFAGIYIEKSSGSLRKWFLILSIIANVGFLAFFKYFNFLNMNLKYFADLIHWNYPIGMLNIILPIGLSFHTFQAMSYTIEVFRGKQKAERHFGIYALYVMFYPQLVAGPIERPQNLIHQFYEQHHFDYQRVTDGLKLMLWGMFKKVVIADRLAVLVNIVYGDPSAYTGIPLLVATIFFAFQIYCDFSGYSDIAIGAAQVMGFKLMDNFNRPYYSKSIAEFWKRWHISLSSWFRDYLYISMGGSRVPIWRWQFNLFFTFLVSGLWHGANWTYVIWGAINGFYLLSAIWAQDIWSNYFKRPILTKHHLISKYLKVAGTFALVCFAWIFFRAKNVPDAWYIVTHIFDLAGQVTSLGGLKRSLAGLGFTLSDYTIAFAAIAFMEYVHLIQRHNSIRHMLRGKPLALRWAIYYILVIAILFFGAFNSSVQFIYFQF